MSRTDAEVALGRLLAVRTTRMTMGDTDAAGLLYFAAVYPWAEQLFTSWLHDIGHPLSALLRDGMAVPCVHSEATYRSALTLDMPFELRLSAQSVGRTSFGFVLDVYRDGDATASVTVRTRHVFGRKGATGAVAPEPLPDWLAKALG